MSKHLEDSLKHLKLQMKNFNKAIDSADEAIDGSLGLLLKGANDAQRVEITQHMAGIKGLLSKAKKGEDIKEDVEIFKKNINAGKDNK